MWLRTSIILLTVICTGSRDHNSSTNSWLIRRWSYSPTVDWSRSLSTVDNWQRVDSWQRCPYQQGSLSSPPPFSHLPSSSCLRTMSKRHIPWIHLWVSQTFRPYLNSGKEITQTCFCESVLCDTRNHQLLGVKVPGNHELVNMCELAIFWTLVLYNLNYDMSPYNTNLIRVSVSYASFLRNLFISLCFLSHSFTSPSNTCLTETILCPTWIVNQSHPWDFFVIEVCVTLCLFSPLKSLKIHLGVRVSESLRERDSSTRNTFI